MISYVYHNQKVFENLYIPQKIYIWTLKGLHRVLFCDEILKLTKCLWTWGDFIWTLEGLCMVIALHNLITIELLDLNTSSFENQRIGSFEHFNIWKPENW